MTAEEIIREVTDRYDMAPVALKGRTKQGRFVAARREAAKRLVSELGLTHKEIARYLGSSPSTVSDYVSDRRWEDRKMRRMQRGRALRVVAA